jgi:hypothetical protein
MRIASNDDAHLAAESRKVHEKPPDRHEIVTEYGLFAGRNCFLCDLREGLSLRLVRARVRCFDGSRVADQAEQTTGEASGKEG